MKRHCALLGIACLLYAAFSTMSSATAAIVPSSLVKLSALTGRDVQNPQGDDIGQIEDVVIDAAAGQVAYAVLSFGGFLGFGESWVVVPWRSLQTTNRGQTLTLDISEKQLKNAPNFDPDQWPDMEDRHWGDTIHAYYGQAPYWREQLPPMGAHETSEPYQFQLLRSSQALRHDVINPRDQYIGTIEDIVIDTALGDIAYAVLSFSGFLGLEEKWFAVPWGAFESSPGFRTLTLDVTEAALNKAPGFDKDDWPEMANLRWATAVHEAFGQPPYWERPRQAKTAPESGDTSSAKRPKQSRETARMQKASQAAVMVTNANGTVLALIGPVTISCQPQQAVAGDVPAIAQSNETTSEVQRELVIERQSGKVQVGCQPMSPREDTSETSTTQQ